MNAGIDFLNSAGTWFIAFALPMLIQSSVLVLVILGIDLLVRKKVRAVFRYGLWMLVLVKLMLPASLSSPTGLGYWWGIPMPEILHPSENSTSSAQEPMALSMENPLESILPEPVNPIQSPAAADMMIYETPPTNPIVEESEQYSSASSTSMPISTEPSPVISWQAIVLLVWLVIVHILFLLLVQRVFFVRGLVAQAQDAKGAVISVLDQCREKMGIYKEISIKFSANATSPSVCGLWKPVILFPHHLVKQLNREELESVLWHELAHIKRRDLWVNLWQTILQILYFFHPLVWLANILIRRVREQAVDEAVLVAMKKDAEDYSNTLVRVFRMSLRRPALSLRLIGVVESKKSLASRIKHMIDRPLPQKAKLGLLGMLMVFVLGAILIPMAQANKLGEHSETETSGEANISFVEEVSWGEVVEGMQFRLRCDRQQWNVGETPTWKFDVRNTGESPSIYTKAHGCMKIDIDGRISKFPQIGKTVWHNLKPGQEHRNLIFKLDPPIDLTPGKHTVKIIFAIQTSHIDSFSCIQVPSNPIEIEILPVKEEKPSWGDPVKGVQMRLHTEKKQWPTNTLPKLWVDIRNTGTRDLNTSLIASLALEIDGKPYAPRSWWRLGTIGVMPFGPGKEYSIDIKLSYFVSEGKGAEELAPGKHTIKAVYLDNNSDDGRGLNTSLNRYKEMALAYSKPVEISIILAEAKWGPPANGLRAAVEFIPEKASYTQGKSVAVCLHVQNISDSDIEFKSESTRQDWALVKDKDGNDVKVQRLWHSGTVYSRRHNIKPSEVLILKTTGLGFAELEDQTLDEFKSKQDYYVGSIIRSKPDYYVGSILRSKPGTYAIHYKVNRNLETGIRKVTIDEKPQIELNQVSMKQAIETLARKYRARLCFEDIVPDTGTDSTAEPYLLTGRFKAPIIPKLLDQLTKSGPFAWVKYNETYVVYPRKKSVLEFPVSIDISESPLEFVARKVLDKMPAGKEIEIKSPTDSVVPDANKKGNIQRLWISSSPARYALSRAVEESGRGDTEIVWTFTKEQGRRRLTFHYLPRLQNSNEPKVSTPAENSAEVSTQVKPKDSSRSAQFIKTSMNSATAAPAKELAGHPGRIRGVVLSAVDRKPVADAYVGVGDFWDSGGSNHSRHRKDGLYAKTKTDAQGRFKVDGLVFSEAHPEWDLHTFFVTHPDFIRHDQKVKISDNKPVGELEILLKPTAKIKATVVDENGSPLPGLWLLRLEALDGHRFIAPDGDPHLSAFANSTWTQGPMTRRGQMYSSEFTFTQLKPGQYRLDAIQFRMKKIISNRSGRYAMPWDPTGFAFHGGIAKISAIAGQTIKVQIRPQNHGTTLQLKMPEIKNKEKFPQVTKIPALVSVSRNPGLLAWDSDRVYSLEDSRLGRIQDQALFFTMAGGADSITVRNLPPGVYTVYAGPMMLMNAVKVGLTVNQTLTAQPPPIQIQKKTGNVNTGRLRRRVQMDLSEYTLQALCQLCTERTQSKPRIMVDPALAEQKITIASGSYEIWDLLEKLYVECNWKITETKKEKQTLVIQSSP